MDSILQLHHMFSCYEPQQQLYFPYVSWLLFSSYGLCGSYPHMVLLCDSYKDETTIKWDLGMGTKTPKPGTQNESPLFICFIYLFYMLY